MVIYTPATSDEIRRDLLEDIDLEARNVGVDDPPVQPGTDWYILATAVSQMGLIMYANIEARDAAASELTAVGNDLDAKRDALGLPVVAASPATGKVVPTISGTRAIPEGTQLLANGVRYEISQTYPAATDGDELNTVCLDKGKAGNLGAGVELKFVSPPQGVEETAVVSSQIPLTGGVDAEDDERKRARILNVRRYKPEGGAGKIGHLREISFNALASLQNVFVYCALGGPASAKVSVTRYYDRDNSSYSRVLDDAALAIVRGAIHGQVPCPDEYVVTTVANEIANVSLQLDLPDSVLVGGAGNGWSDAVPWPQLEGAEAVVGVNSCSGNVLTVSALTTTAPLDGITKIAWWSSVDQKFRTYTVVSHSGSAGAWALTLDRNVVDSTGTAAVVDEYVSPAMDNAVGYGKTWVDAMEALGPSEMTTDTNRLPRSYREPKPEVESPQSISILMLKALIDAHPEIADGEYSYRSKTSPTVPASVDDPPNVLVTNNFGIYPQ